MRRVIFKLDGQRLDRPDAEALHALPDEALRDILRGLVSGAEKFVLGGFEVTLTGPSEPKQINVALGAAVSGWTRDDGVTEYGQLLDEGLQAALLYDFAGLAAGTYSVWVRFAYVEGQTANRAYLADVAGVGVERVQPTETRLLADWELTATRDGVDPDPGFGWLRVARVAYSGADLVDTDIVLGRESLFEGVGTASGWALPDHSRGDHRLANGLTTLKTWAWAIMRRVQELGGAKWHRAPLYAENVRSASTEIGIVDGTGDADSAHLKLTSPVAALALTVQFAGGVGQDPRAGVVFHPQAAAPGQWDIDASAGSVLLSASTIRRYIRGAGGILSRTAGANALLTNAGAALHTFRGLTFRAAAGGDPLLLLNGGDLTFVDCRFEDTGGATSALVELTGAARVRFINCTWVPAAGADGLLVNHAGADVVLDGCTWAGGRYGAQIATTPARLLVRAPHFTGGIDTGIKGAAGGEVLELTGPTSDGSIVTALVDLGGTAPVFYSGAGAADALVPNTGDVRPSLDAGVLRARKGRLYLDHRTGGAAGGRYIYAADGFLKGTARDLGALDADFRYLHAGGRRVMLQSGTAGRGRGMVYDPTEIGGLGLIQIADVDDPGGGEVVTPDVGLNADRILLGRTIGANAAGWLTRHTALRGWVRIRVDEGFAAPYFQVESARGDGTPIAVTRELDDVNGDAHYYTIRHDAFGGGIDTCFSAQGYAGALGQRNYDQNAAFSETLGRTFHVDLRQLQIGGDVTLVLVPYMREPNGDIVHFKGDATWATAIGTYWDLPKAYEIHVQAHGKAGAEFVEGGGDLWP